MLFNYVLVIFLAIYILQLCLDLWLERLNLKHSHKFGNQVPSTFAGFIDAKKLSEISSYTTQKTHLGVIHQLISESVLLAMILFGFLPFLVKVFEAWNFSDYSAGLLFFLVPGLSLYIIDLPFSYYGTFVIEERFGFNRSTIKIWIVDHIKSGMLTLVLFSILFTIILWMIDFFPRSWWLWAFTVMSLLQIILGILYPVLIAPLFNKFESIKDELLAKKILRLVEENGIKVKKILQMNAGIRSRHSNAYFTGLGKTKQIVLFDTLLDSHPHDEILSILAHEIGHFKKKHIVKQLLFFEASMLIAFYLTYLLMEWPLLYATFGFARPHPYAGLFFVGILWQKAGFFLQPVYMEISRRFERQADLFVHQLLRNTKPLIFALKRMAADNLSNLTPHPLYVWFNYSHPPLIERIATLEDANLASGLSQRQEGSKC